MDILSAGAADTERTQILLAVEQFTARITVPVWYDNPDHGADQIGSGTLFANDGRLFLLTARHLFDECDPGRFAVPQPPHRKVHSLGPYTLWKPNDEAFDVVLLELQDPATISRMKAGWQIVQIENTAHASDIGTFVLCGYPSALGRRTEDTIASRLLTVFTQRLPEAPPNAKPPVYPGLDMFFHYDREAPTIDGTMRATPHLCGVSGASVWEYREPATGLWAPELALKIVGVQSSFMEGRYFRAKSWAAVLEILHQSNPRQVS